MTTTKNVHPNEAIAIPVGTAVPTFTLYNTDGQAYSLADIPPDKPLILVFYRGDWCPYCQLQMHQLSQVYSDIVARGAELWAISPQSQAQNQAFREKRDIQFPILGDTDLAVINRWGLRDELDPSQEQIPHPTTYIILNGQAHWRRMGHRKDDRPTPGEIIAALP